MNRIYQIFIVFCIISSIFPEGRLFTQIIDLYIPYKDDDYIEYDKFIRKYAPSGDAIIAIQRMAEPYLRKKQWINALKVFDKYRDLFQMKDYYFQRMISLLSGKDEQCIIKNLGAGINTNADEYNPVPTIDGKKIYFNSKNRFDSFGGEDIYISEFRDNYWQNGINAGNMINTKLNDFITGISADENRIVLMGAYLESLGSSDLFYRDNTNDGWSDLRHFPYPINTEYFESDGFLTSDGKALLFVSDRPESPFEQVEKNTKFHGDYWGNTDIYVSTLNDSGWSKPVNLGTVINTPYAERTPFLHPDGKTLYFSSDGHYGLGRLDVFKATRLKEDSWTEWSEPINLGKEINTTGNDYGYKIATKGDIAFFTKNDKLTGHGGDDIYSITLPEKGKPESVITIQGKVTDKFGNPLECEIIWEDLLTGQNIGRLKNDPVNGTYIIALPYGKHYGYYAKKEGYYPSSNNINLKNINKMNNMVENIYLPRLDTSVIINNLFFTYNNSELDRESFPELNRLVKIINEHSDNAIEIAGYTDSVGSIGFNRELGLKRANAVKNYLVKQGCKKETISVKSFGKLRPNASNSTEEGRSKNRRVEFCFLIKEEQNITKQDLNLFRKSSVDIKVQYRIYTDGKTFSILISNWENKDDAIKDALSLRLKGYDAFTIKTYSEEINQEWYEVRIGNINSEKEAVDLLKVF
jgi:outer membrane protein OmpA-like peptidoglycan-associated protein